MDCKESMRIKKILKWLTIAYFTVGVILIPYVAHYSDMVFKVWELYVVVILFIILWGPAMLMLLLGY